MASLFTGVGVALVTLFRDDGALDAAATAELAAALTDLGVRAVLVAGTTGEAAALTPTNAASWSRPSAPRCPSRCRSSPAPGCRPGGRRPS